MSRACKGLQAAHISVFCARAQNETNESCGNKAVRTFTFKMRKSLALTSTQKWWTIITCPKLFRRPKRECYTDAQYFETCTFEPGQGHRGVQRYVSHYEKTAFNLSRHLAQP